MLTTVRSSESRSYGRDRDGNRRLSPSENIEREMRRASALAVEEMRFGTEWQVSRWSEYAARGGSVASDAGQLFRRACYLTIHPHGVPGGDESRIGVFLNLAPIPEWDRSYWAVAASFQITLVNQVDRRRSVVRSCQHQLTRATFEYGFADFAVADVINSPAAGFVVDDALVVEFEIRATRLKREPVAGRTVIRPPTGVLPEPVIPSLPRSRPVRASANTANTRVVVESRIVGPHGTYRREVRVPLTPPPPSSPAASSSSSRSMALAPEAGGSGGAERASTECIICFDAPRQVVFKTCGHICCCVRCGYAMSACPICRTPYRSDTDMIKFFVA